MIGADADEPLGQKDASETFPLRVAGVGLLLIKFYATSKASSLLRPCEENAVRRKWTELCCCSYCAPKPDVEVCCEASSIVLCW